MLGLQVQQPHLHTAEDDRHPPDERRDQVGEKVVGAKIFGLYPRKGAIAVGSDADLVVYDPAGQGVVSASTQVQRVDRNIYEGFTVRGRVALTIAAGRAVYSNGTLAVRRGAGRYLRRGTTVS